MHPKLISISESLSPTEKQDHISLTKEYIDIFAWIYEDMPGLDPQVAMHHLNIKLDAKPVTQQQRTFRPDVMEAIEVEVQKLTKYGFIRQEQHPDWVVNIVLVLKNNRKIRVCIDFHDLNITCLKTNFRYSSLMSLIYNTCDF